MEKQKQRFKSLQISVELHARLKKFCVLNDLWIGEFVENAINEAINKHNKD